jgi:hypothetical protein
MHICVVVFELLLLLYIRTYLIHPAGKQTTILQCSIIAC